MKHIIAHIALLVQDYDEAIAFYTQKLGFNLTEDTHLDDGKRWVRVALPGASETCLLLAICVMASVILWVGVLRFRESSTLAMQAYWLYADGELLDTYKSPAQSIDPEGKDNPKSRSLVNLRGFPGSASPPSFWRITVCLCFWPA